MPDSNPFLDPELDVYITETPYGIAHATFQADDEDGSGVRFDEGEWPASSFMLDRINETTGPDGIRLDAATITGELYHDFCQPEGSGVTIHRPAYLEPELEADREGGMTTDAVPSEEAIEQARQKTNTDPTEKQKHAGNYAKGSVKIHGLVVKIENPKGSERSGMDASGREWRQSLAHDYGYLQGIPGADGDELDVFVGPDLESDRVFVIDQNNEDGAFDEHKIMLGFLTEANARQGYLDCYEIGWGGLGRMREMSVSELTTWARDLREGAPAMDDAADTKQSISGLRNEINNASGSLAKLAAARRLLQVITERADDDSDDPNSPNYRFRDTGVIAGARKMEVTNSFREAARKGQLMRWQTIDWEAVEDNPRKAKELITKPNLFGKVDWDGLKTEGMDPGAAFLVDRVYASVGKEPTEDSPQMRQDYARGIESVRERLETCKTPDEVHKTLQEMREEWRGVMLTADESATYQAALAEQKQLEAAYQPLKEQFRLLREKTGELNLKIQNLEGQQYTYGRRRKGKRDPELDAKIEALKPQQEQALDELRAFESEHRMRAEPRQTGRGTTMYLNDHEWEIEQARARANAVKQAAMNQNLVRNPTTRAWIALGSRFHAVLAGKSDSFNGHRANVRTGKVADWSWAEKGSTGPKTTKRAAQFQLEVADTVERVGGQPITVDSTAALKGHFGLRDVQSGNWVLKDPEAAHWHVEQAAGAFMDLADLLGADPSTVAMNGRLALALGARGKGNAGFGGAARAHYEPVERVINITKMKGGGTLAHEWFHALDNLISEAHGLNAGADAFASEQPEVRDALPPKLGATWETLYAVMESGTHRATRTVAIDERSRSLARLNLGERTQRGLPEEIKAAGSLEAAVAVVDRAEQANTASRERYGKTPTKKDRDRYEDWRKIAVAHYTPEDTQEVTIPYGPPMSLFALEARKLDGGRKKPYWSSTREMAARAFQAWCEDRLSGQQRRNDYLSAKADNRFYNDPIFGPVKPFPEGDERELINQAFDELVGAMREHGTLKAVMDAVFGDEGPIVAWWDVVLIDEQGE